MKTADKALAALAAKIKSVPHFSCAHLPTPLEPLTRLSAHLGGPSLWIKRDDCTGLATGGNKARKLEYLIGEAVAKDADLVITHGALQSNHVRQTAAAAAMANMRCEVLYEHRIANIDNDYATSGNVLLTKLLGAKCSEYANGTDMDAQMHKLADARRAAGDKLYVIAGGGSGAVGAMGYANCVLELAKQSAHLGFNIDHIVHASGSGGTQAGLVVGCHAVQSPLPILGISIRLPRLEQEQKVFNVACEAVQYLGLAESLPRQSVQVNSDYVGDGYGLPTAGMQEAVLLLARLEGIVLDPVYTGKGMAGLIDLIRRGYFAASDNVVFVHTGGSAGLFGYRSVFAEALQN